MPPRRTTTADDADHNADDNPRHSGRRQQRMRRMARLTTLVDDTQWSMLSAVRSINVERVIGRPVWGGVFAQRQSLRCLSREHPCKPPPYRSVHDPFKTASGGGVQNSGPWDPWLPVVESSLLFAQRTVRPLYPPEPFPH